jgi:hypothetical protein
MNESIGKDLAKCMLGESAIDGTEAEPKKFIVDDEDEFADRIDRAIAVLRKVTGAEFDFLGDLQKLLSGEDKMISLAAERRGIDDIHLDFVEKELEKEFGMKFEVEGVFLDENGDEDNDGNVISLSFRQIDPDQGKTKMNESVGKDLARCILNESAIDGTGAKRFITDDEGELADRIDRAIAVINKATGVDFEFSGYLGDLISGDDDMIGLIGERGGVDDIHFGFVENELEKEFGMKFEVQGVFVDEEGDEDNDGDAVSLSFRQIDLDESKAKQSGGKRF